MFTDETRLCCILLGRPFPLTHLFQVHKGHCDIYHSVIVLRLCSNLDCLRMLVQSTEMRLEGTIGTLSEQGIYSAPNIISLDIKDRRSQYLTPTV